MIRKPFGERKFALFMVLVVVVSLFAPYAMAKTPSTEVVAEGVLPATSQVNNFTVSNSGGDAAYVEPSNTATDSVVKYYFVTYSSAYTNNTPTTVTYKGTDYPATVIKFTQKTISGTGQPNNTPYSVIGASLTEAVPVTAAGGFQAQPNSTYFFDEGNFVDDSPTYNWRISAANSSIVGLKKDSSGESKTKIYKAPYTTQTGNMAAYSGYLARFMVDSADLYYENLIFDGLGYDMGPNGNSFSGDLAIAKSRGEDFFTVGANCSNFVMRDVVLQNVGYDSTTDGNALAGTQRKNVGLWVRLALNGQRNFENLKIRNIKTKSAANCGTVHLQATANNYFKNLDMSENTQMGSTAYPVRIEQHTDAYASTHGKNAVFAGTLKFPTIAGASAYKCVFVGDYRYRNIIAPSGFNYAVCNSSSSAPAIKLYEELQPRANAWATLDLNTGYWLMDADNSSGTGNATLNQQLTSLQSVASRQRTVDSALAKPAPNILITPRADGKISGFTIPDLVGSSGYNNTSLPVNILVQDSNTPTLSSYVKFTTETALAFPSTNTSKVQLFGVNFADPAQWSIDDATTGGKITRFARGNSGSNLFYTELIDVGFYNQYDESLIETQTIEPGTAPVAPSPTRTGYDFAGWSTTSTPDPSETLLSNSQVDTTTLVNDTNYYAVWNQKQYDVTFLDYDSSFVASSTIGYGDHATSPANPVRAGYTFLGWSTSPSGGTILSPDQINALEVTESVTYYARYAIDKYVVTFIDYDGAIVSRQADIAYGGHATSPADPTRAGYTFLGWSLSPSGLGSLFSGAVIDGFAVTDSVTYYAQYAKNETPKPPTPPNPPEPPTPPTPPSDTGDGMQWVIFAILALVASGAITLVARRDANRRDFGKRGAR